MTARELLKIVVVGHVDHGKSTIIGRLLYDTKSVPETAIERVKRISKEKGRPFEYAYLLDALEEEQKQGITIDTTQIKFSTPKRDYLIIDAPGHKEFLKNMVSGAANAEAGLLVIDATEGVQEQSKRHAYILSLLGIQKVYVIVNKMDMIGFSEEKFKEIKYEISTFLDKLNVYPQKYIPVSGFLGENITRKSDKMPWYKGETLLQALDLFEKDKELEDRLLRFPIQDVYKFDHRRIIAGRLESGRLKVGDEIKILPEGKVSKVKSIEFWPENNKKDEVVAGMSIGITIEDEFFNKRGEVIVHKNDDTLYVSDTFRANLFWLGKRNLEKNKTYKLKLVTQETECEIVSIDKVIDATTLETVENALDVQTNDVAEVTIKTKEKICFDEFKVNPTTGRFVLVDEYDVSGGGIISGLANLKEEATKFVKDDKEMIVHCFDEYYYSLSEGLIRKHPKYKRTFKVGDAVPIDGETYSYPESFDVIDINGKLVAKIRKGQLSDLVNIDQYIYSKLPIITADGFYLKVNSIDEFEDFKNELVQLQKNDNFLLAMFANKWYDISANRNFKFTV
ncbi:sulfate adenylyltransferase subunit 1 [Caldicellulosiruptor bescii]|uniref:sulfate adenylyltransferase n=2 Tax=Caldicellulosiruptor bescii TaxID=31899 RepID=B9MRJ0_CALBD|nr:GTP-binding protein [Caldicellulosiruptor bescii]ACM60294.1 sulfate adenylyltransferase, large subunit [Caldicellulosiruptor bescii DSM 6725]PBC87709.1 sulfate adenylyltransferase subunit 1 [Caldicellulosiruptor bescii]PBD03926.1 sulfate adenylyltransferase subunit 1 [Caldicellulosiruptor bescii]PBD08555.1 sulfate adenylyltransferase subunit 1 [Caldicellulosiruptor bescii]PFH15041.1 sulfate adenylyltransferase subunit 1 [Caldicellulosiruptor bescii]